MPLFGNKDGSGGPSFEFEERAGGKVAGVDEAGRGPWAGPVVAASVLLNRDRVPAGLNDSKKLSAKRRSELFDLLMESAEVGIGQASVEEIDRLNILQASLLAMCRAVAAMPAQPDHCLIDGNRMPALEIPATCLVKGDARSFSVAAASIVAKVTRDRIMRDLAAEYPEYGWETNAGYGVPHHMKALDLVGVSPHHRKSFSPIHKILSQDSDVTN